MFFRFLFFRLLFHNFSTNYWIQIHYIRLPDPVNSLLEFKHWFPGITYEPFSWYKCHLIQCSRQPRREDHEGRSGSGFRSWIKIKFLLISVVDQHWEKRIRIRIHIGKKTDPDPYSALGERFLFISPVRFFLVYISLFLKRSLL